MGLNNIPNEILDAILSNLPQKSVKQLRLVSKATKTKVKLRITRAILSPNRTNIDVFRNILSHPEFNKDVKEIVWDDVRFHPYRDGSRQYRDPLDKYVSGFARLRGQGSKCYDDFVEDAGELENPIRDNELSMRRIREVHGDDAELITTRESFELYQQLYKEQQDIIETAEDVEVLRMGLLSFPALERVTVTSEGWQPSYLFPLYESPLFRSLPPGFVCPSLWPWLGRNFVDEDLEGEEEILVASREEPHPEWRGWSIIVAELLSTAAHHKVSELVVDVNRELTGIGYQLFGSSNPDYDLTLQLFGALPLTRLDLALNVRTAETDGFGCFRNGLLKNALSKLTHLEHLSLHMNMPTGPNEDELDDDDDAPWVSPGHLSNTRHIAPLKAPRYRKCGRPWT